MVGNDGKASWSFEASFWPVTPENSSGVSPALGIQLDDCEG